MSDFRGQRENCLKIRHGTHRQPRSPQAVQVDLLLDSLPDVARRLAMPEDVGNVSRRVIEGGDANAGVVRGCDERVARSEAGADDAQPVVALLLQPVEAAANIHHALARGGEGAPDVGGNRIVGAANLSGHADVVVRHGEPQHGNAEQVEDAAQAHVRNAVGIPVRQQNDGAASLHWEPARVHEIVFWIGRYYR